jgi:hypothetical protein
MISWIFLLIAALFECGWAVGLKYTESFTRLWPSVFTVGNRSIGEPDAHVIIFARRLLNVLQTSMRTP